MFVRFAGTEPCDYGVSFWISPGWDRLDERASAPLMLIVAAGLNPTRRLLAATVALE